MREHRFSSILLSERGKGTDQRAYTCQQKGVVGEVYITLVQWTPAPLQDNATCCWNPALFSPGISVVNWPHAFAIHLFAEELCSCQDRNQWGEMATIQEFTVPVHISVSFYTWNKSEPRGTDSGAMFLVHVQKWTGVIQLANNFTNILEEFPCMNY